MPQRLNKSSSVGTILVEFLSHDQLIVKLEACGISKEYPIFMVLFVQSAFIPGFTSFLSSFSSCLQSRIKTKTKTNKLTC